MILRVPAAAAFGLSLVGLSASLHAQTIEIKLPEVCASLSMPHADKMQGGDNMQTMQGMGEPSQAYMKGMMEMNQQMMPAMMIQDPDIAFNCSMIVHHQGAIAMAETQLKYGKDETTKKRGQKIIDDQKKEIDQMTKWLEKHANKS